MSEKKKKSDAVNERDEVEVTTPADTQQTGITDQLVSALRAQVQDSEKRHGDVLTSMKERLGTLGDDVSEIRHRIPKDLPRKIEGLETGLESLSERVFKMSIGASGASDEDSALTSTAPFQDQDSEIKFDEIDNEHIDHDSQQNTLIEIDDVDTLSDMQDDINEPSGEEVGSALAPAALKSASHDADFSERPMESTTSPQAQGIDTFDMVDTGVAGDPDSPWDEESAEALTRLYDAPSHFDSSDGEYEAEATLAETQDDELDAVAQGSEPASFEVTESASAMSSSGVDRAWLDAKFSEIAERIELTLSELDPAKSQEHINERIESFENRVGLALDGVATREDVGGLQDVQAQMQRLESIEGSLHDVMARFASGGELAQFADTEGMPAGGIDADAIAETAALRIADQLQASGQGADSNAIAEMRHMIEGFLDEHRQGNEHTALMLDTIQQAMIRILDRLDVLENATERSGAEDVSAPQTKTVDQSSDADLYQDQQLAVDEVAMAAEGWVDPNPAGNGSDDDIRLSKRSDDMATSMGSIEDEATVEFHERDGAGEAPSDEVSNPEPVPHYPAQDALAGSVAPAEAVSAQDLAGSAPSAGGSDTSAEPSPDLLSDRSDAVVVPAKSDTNSREAIEKIRHNFIADAQQAKALAAQTAAAAVEAAPTQISRKSVLPSPSSAKSGESKGGFLAGILGSKTRRLLAGAILAVVAIQGAMVLLPRGETSTAPASEPAAVTGSQEQSSQKKAAKDPQKSSTLVPSDGFSPAVTDDVVMNDLRLAAADAKDRALGAVDLPFGLTLHETTAKNWTKEGRPIFNSKPTVRATPIALTPNATTTTQTNGARVYKAPQRQTSKQRIALPPLTVGPTSLRMAAAKGDASAQFEVATRLSEGKGTKQDFKEAAIWFKRSAGQGFAQAQYRLGTLYERGLGVERDTGRAQMWYLRAAEQGNIRAMHNLAVLAAGQSSGHPDYPRAAQWFLKAAESGLADSQFNVGVLYENGLGVGKNQVEAYKWYTLAARTGDKESLKRSQKLRSKLPIDKLGEAETAVRSFKPTAVDPMINNARIAGEDWKKRQST